ncbi:MAG: DUF1574 family protein [Candidatus Obscuribacterales bacterium]|nr:DUF1574 family protein [Candidatus Obscuribacterales bacterium]
MSSSDSNKPFNPKPGSIFSRLPIIGALIIVLALNLVLALANPLQKIDPENLPVGHGWAWWAANEYQKPDSTFNTVVFGSSAMMHPLWLGEATFRNEDVDLVVDHRSRCLEEAIKKGAPGTQPSCFNFAMPGAMPSDDYMIMKALFKSDKKPKLVVITLHPRDLMDNTFGSAATSRHYKYLSRFVDTRPLLELAMPEVWRRLVYQLEQTLFIKSKNHDIQLLASESIGSAMKPLLAHLPKSQLDAKDNEDRKLAIYVDELQQGVWIAHPTAPYHFINALDDCLRRFKKPNDAQFKNQTTWLKMCLSTCKQEGIQVLLVNTPVTDTVKQLMPPGTYERHLSTIQALSVEYNCPVLNANEATQYEQTDFTDWIHMNGDGGQKVLGCIGKFIADNQQLKASLPIAAQLAGKPVHRM